MSESDPLVMLAMFLLDEIASGKTSPESAVDEYASAIADGVSEKRMLELQKEIS